MGTAAIIQIIISVLGAVISGIVLATYNRGKTNQDVIGAKVDKLAEQLTDFRITVASSLISEKEFGARNKEVDAILAEIERRSQENMKRVHERIDEILAATPRLADIDRIRDRQHAHANMIVRIWDRQQRCTHCNPKGAGTTEPLPEGF